MKDAIDFASKFYGLTGIEFRGTGRKPDQPLNEMERWLWSNISIYGSYDFMDPKFDTTNLNELVHDLPCPALDYEMASRLMTYAEEDRWGKRKKPQPSAAALDIEKHLEETCDPAASTNTSIKIVADVLGIGGGAWTIEFAKDQLVGFAKGIAGDADGTLSITMAELLALQGKAADAASVLSSKLKLSRNDMDSQDVARNMANCLFVREPVKN